MAVRKKKRGWKRVWSLKTALLTRTETPVAERYKRSTGFSLLNFSTPQCSKCFPSKHGALHLMGSPLRKEQKRLLWSPSVFISPSLSTKAKFGITYDSYAPLCSKFDIISHRKTQPNGTCSGSRQNRTSATRWLVCALLSSNTM